MNEWYVTIYNTVHNYYAIVILIQVKYLRGVSTKQSVNKSTATLLATELED